MTNLYTTNNSLPILCLLTTGYNTSTNTCVSCTSVSNCQCGNSNQCLICNNN